MGTIRDRNCGDLGDAEEIKKRGKEYTELAKKILMNWFTTMVLSVTQTQTFWRVRASGPYETLLLIKLVDHHCRHLSK